MYRSEMFMDETKKALYCIEEANNEVVFTNSSINFIVYSDTSLYEEVFLRLADTIMYGKTKAIIQVYDEDMESNDDDRIFTYKNTPLEEILNIVSEETELEDSEYLNCPKVFVLGEFLKYEYRDRTKFISEIYGAFFKRIIKERNIMFIIPIKVNKMPDNFKAETYDNDEYSDYNIAIDLMEESSGTLAKFHFLFGFKQVLNSVSI